MQRQKRKTVIVNNFNKTLWTWIYNDCAIMANKDFLWRKWAHRTQIRQKRLHIKKKRQKKYGRFILVFDCYSFNNILEYRKIDKISPKCMLFLQNMILDRAIRSILYDNRQILLWFLKNFVVPGSCLHEFEMCYGCVFQNRSYCINEKIERWPRDTPKTIFLFYFWGWKYAMSKHTGLSFKSHF